LNWTTVSDYTNANRLLVAGGGGGGTGNGGATGGTGGYSSGSTSGSYGGFTASGGTQTTGGTPSGSTYSSAANGSLGQGGSGYGGANDGVDREWNGGGGGGYFGGAAHSYHGGGGGGSSYYNSTYVASFLHTTGGGSAKQTSGSASVQILSVGTTVPDAPTIGVATAIDSSTATVSFTAPSNNGGASITSYTATSTPETISATLNQSGSGTITVTGLTPGSTYNFKVLATNSVGNSQSSIASNTISLPKASTLISANLASSPATFRIQNALVFNSNYQGKASFKVNGKAIPNCVNVLISTIFTCQWKPSLKGFVTITIAFTPTNSARNSTPTPISIRVFVNSRSGVR
jgi:hypothetical protein